MRRSFDGAWAVLAVLLAGCASSPPQPSREQMLAMTTHSYPGKTPGAILDAARRVFELSDGDDYTFVYPTVDSMVATRSWTIYGLITYMHRQDRWTVTAGPGGEVRAGLELGNTQSIVGSYDMAPVYEILWGRLAYELGESDRWPTCAEYGWDGGNILTAGAGGAMEAWCGVTVADAAP